ncbi:MAG: lipopolysaccharide heptosyltransferase family protein [Cyanobacteria bacterium REEB459]|nr:lipopolysaccharide heptosyltransferase family protein [Cyanobacteria bacterium REEB459]
MRVLALVPGGIERQLEFFPLLSHIKDRLASAEITVVADPNAQPAYTLSKAVKEVIPYSFGAANSPADWANLLGILRDREFEVVITLTQSWFLGLLLWLSGIPMRIGYGGGGNGLLLTHAIDGSSSSGYGPLLTPLNLTTQLSPPVINLPQADLKRATAVRQKASLDSGYVAIYPGCLPGGDSYPTESWIMLVEDFQQRQPNLPLVLLQTSESVEEIARLKQAMPNLTVLVPETLGQLAALIASANLVIAVNRYPLFLAAALGVYAVGLTTDLDGPTPSQADRLVMIASDNTELAGIQPATIIKKVWNE